MICHNHYLRTGVLRLLHYIKQLGWVHDDGIFVNFFLEYGLKSLNINAINFLSHLFVSVRSPFNAIKIVPFSISFHLPMSTFSVLPLNQAYNYPVVLINTRTQSKTSKHLFSSSPVKLNNFKSPKWIIMQTLIIVRRFDQALRNSSK